MNATDTTAPATRRTAHADCAHAATKVARAACRRAKAKGWALVTREDVAKGDAVRVTSPGGLPVEGELLGWGKARLILRGTDGVRVTFEVSDALVVEAPAA